MKDEREYKVFYINEKTGEQVAFQHCMPVRFNRERAEQFIKDINFDRWYGGGSPLPILWKMKAIPIETNK